MTELLANVSTIMNTSFKSNLEEVMTQQMIPALTKCFGIIVIGYIFGWSKILNQHGTKGLCIFLQYLSLPALIFSSLATISTSNIQWNFIAAILVAKVIVFVITAVITMIMTKPLHLGKAGIYAIASTQSNDIALGYPLMMSLYKTTHPDFPSILYIIVPIQLLVLNPVGIFLLETFKRRTDSQYSREHTIFAIIKGTLKNPFIISTILGIIWNYAFHHHVPLVLNELLESLGVVFSPLALFLLGYSMSSGVEAVKGYFSLTPAVLVLTKIFVLPLVLQKITELFLKNCNEDKIHDFSSLGFLYGTIPSAPTVFIFAKHYNIAVNIIASVTVYSTLFSLPLMMTSATMISLVQSSFENIKTHLRDTITYTSAINMCCCLLVLFIIIIKQKWRDACTISIIYILLAQMLMSAGGILLISNSQDKHLFNAQYILALSGLFLTRLFAVFLGFLIYLLQKRSLCFVLKHKVFINTVIGLIIPLGTTTILVLCLTQSAISYKSWDLDFQFNYIQIITLLSVTSVALILTIAFLVLQHKYMKNETFNEDSETSNVHQQLLENDVNQPTFHGHDNYDGDLMSGPTTPNLSDIEDIGNDFEEITCNTQVVRQKKYFKPTCDIRYNCNVESHTQCSSQIENYTHHNPIQNIKINTEYVRYVIILLSICTSMLISIMVCISWLISKSSYGICIELKFLDLILSYGQGSLCLILYGFNGTLRLFKKCCNFKRLISNHEREVSADMTD